MNNIPLLVSSFIFRLLIDIVPLLVYNFIFFIVRNKINEIEIKNDDSVKFWSVKKVVIVIDILLVMYTIIEVVKTFHIFWVIKTFNVQIMG